jgi:hypothetical protein
LFVIVRVFSKSYALGEKYLHILTYYVQVFFQNKEIDIVRVPGSGGEFGIVYDHVPTIAELKPGNLQLKSELYSPSHRSRNSWIQGPTRKRKGREILCKQWFCICEQGTSLLHHVHNLKIFTIHLFQTIHTLYSVQILLIRTSAHTLCNMQHLPHSFIPNHSITQNTSNDTNCVLKIRTSVFTSPYNKISHSFIHSKPFATIKIV